ncbi:MAG: hypothetical protein ACUVTZ_10720 [Armatimonadota bacterium]
MPASVQVALIAIGAANVVLLVAVAVAVLVLKSELTRAIVSVRAVLPKVEEAVEQVKGVLPEVGSTLEQVRTVGRAATEVVQKAGDAVEHVGARAKAIADTSERVVKDISNRVEVTSRVVQEGIVTPVVEVAGALSAIRRAAAVLGARRERKERDKDGEQ